MLAVRDYNKLLDQKQTVEDLIAKTQREKDLKVDTINKKYESKISKLVRKQNEINIVVENTKKFIEKN